MLWSQHCRCVMLLVCMFAVLFAVIQSLGEQIKVRQQVIATATIYFKRFYARSHIPSPSHLSLLNILLCLICYQEKFDVVQLSMWTQFLKIKLKNAFLYLQFDCQHGQIGCIECSRPVQNIVICTNIGQFSAICQVGRTVSIGNYNTL